MKNLLLLISCLCLVSCANNIEKKGIHIFEDECRFKDVKEFEIDELSWAERPKHYNEIDSTAYALLWKGSSKSHTYSKNYFHTFIGEKQNHDLISILTEDENGSCDLLICHIYDEETNLIDKFTLAASCVDEGWILDVNGHFLNDSVYASIKVETIMMPPSDTLEMPVMQGDSSEIHYTILYNGKVEKKKISTKAFKTKIEI